MVWEWSRGTQKNIFKIIFYNQYLSSIPLLAGGIPAASDFGCRTRCTGTALAELSTWRLGRRGCEASGSRRHEDANPKGGDAER